MRRRLRLAGERRPELAHTPYAVVLGTAQDGGFPHVGSDNDHCRAAFADPSLARRVASLGLVTSQGIALVDATPDFAVQWRELAIVAGVSPQTPLAALFLTHLHVGHILGLPLLGKEGRSHTKTPIWSTETNLSALQEMPIFGTLFSEGHVEARPFALGWETNLGDLVVQAVPVPHRSEHGDTVAFRFEGLERSLFYAPDVDLLAPEVVAHIKAADIALIDGTFFRKSELERPDAAQVPHPAIADSMSQLSHVDTQIVFTHLNHTNPAVLPTSREHQAVRALGMRIAREGDVFELS